MLQDSPKGLELAGRLPWLVSRQESRGAPMEAASLKGTWRKFRGLSKEERGLGGLLGLC